MAESHADEIQRLMAVKGDRSFAEAMADAAAYTVDLGLKAEAGAHVRRMLEALLVPAGAFVPRRDLELLLAEYDHLASGKQLPRLATLHAHPCDCDPAFPEMRDTRCCEVKPNA